MDRLFETLADIVESLREQARIDQEDAPELSLELMTGWQAADLLETWRDALAQIAKGEGNAAEIATTAIGILEGMDEVEEPRSEIEKLRAFLNARSV